MPEFPHALLTLAGTQGDLARQLAQLVGPAYQAGDDTRNAADYLALAKGLSDARTTILSLLADAFPDTATNMLAEWEELLALPFRPDLTNAARRERLWARSMAAHGGQPQHIEDVLDILTILATAVAETDASLVLLIPRQVFRLGVVLSIADFDNSALRPLLNELLHVMTPAHAQPLVVTSANFLCDDPASLCDQDLLGV